MSSALQAEAVQEGKLHAILWRQFTKPRPFPAGTKLDGQTCIVTGSNGGVGFEACRQLLALHPSHLIMAVRSEAKGEAAAKQLRDQFPDKSISISVWTLDMASYDSIQKFVARCATLPRIDVVLLNAAGVITTFTPNPDTGHESTFQVVYLSTALLGILLIPVLKSSNARNKSARPPVLSFVGSDLAYSPDFVPKIKSPVLPQFDDKDTFDYMGAYATGKMFLLFLVSRLAELVDPADVLINVSNPGLTRHADLDRDTSVFFKVVMGFFRLVIGRSLPVAASIYLDATLTRGSEAHGSFISDWAIKP